MYEIKKIFLNLLLKIKNIKEKNQNPAPILKRPRIFKTPKQTTTVNHVEDFRPNNVSEEEKKKVAKISEKIIKKYFGDIQKTIKILEKKGIKVHRTRFATKILSNINEKQGFLTPLKGYKAFYLNFFIGLLCDKKLIFNTKSNEMFVFTTKEIDNFYLASQVYRFVAFKKHLPGFEYEIQEKFKKIYKNPNVKNFNALTAGEIFSLKEAIARDVESVDFAAKIYEEINMNSDFSKKNENDTN